MNYLCLGIPVYNSSAYLPELFASLERQTIWPEEIIFVDDTSNDHSVELIKEFIKKHPRANIQLFINHQNLGIAGNYNKIIELCSCQWLHILDADDYLVDDYYIHFLNDLHGEAIAIVTRLSSNSSILNTVNHFLSFFIPRKLPQWLPVLGSIAVRSGVIYKKSEMIPFIEPAFDGSDIIHLIQLRAKGRCLYNKKAKVFYRIHEKSNTQILDSQKYVSYLKTLHGWKKFCYFIDFFIRKKVFGFIRRKKMTSPNIKIV